MRTALRRVPGGSGDERWSMPLWDFADLLADYQDAGVAVLNLSVGVATDDGRAPLVLERAIAQLTPSMVVVAAAGNHGEPHAADGTGDRPPNAALFPAALDNVLAVGALDGTGAAAFTPRGAGQADTAPWIDVFAPGVDVVSTYLGDGAPERVLVENADGSRSPVEFSGWAAWSGTSFATGEITGAVANLLAQGDSPQDAVKKVQPPTRAPSRAPMRDDPVVVDLVLRARAGDRRAWDEIVERFAPLVWGICMRHRLSPADADDVGQSLWLGLLEHLQSIREPAALPGWIATTTRRECLKLHDEARRRRGPVGGEADDDTVVADPTAVPVDEGLLLEELRCAVRAAFARLAPQCRRLLALLVSDPPLPYVRIAEILDVPIGGLGPTRARCLEKLRRSEPLAAFLDGARR